MKFVFIDINISKILIPPFYFSPIGWKQEAFFLFVFVEEAQNLIQLSAHPTKCGRRTEQCGCSCTAACGGGSIELSAVKSKGGWAHSDGGTCVRCCWIAHQPSLHAPKPESKLIPANFEIPPKMGSLLIETFEWDVVITLWLQMIAQKDDEYWKLLWECPTMRTAW